MSGLWESITGAFSSGADAVKKGAQSAVSAVSGESAPTQPDTSLNTGVTTAAGRHRKSHKGGSLADTAASFGGRKGGSLADTAASFGGRKSRKSRKNSRKAGKKGGGIADTAASFGGRKSRKSRRHSRR